MRAIIPPWGTSAIHRDDDIISHLSQSLTAKDCGEMANKFGSRNRGLLVGTCRPAVQVAAVKNHYPFIGSKVDIPPKALTNAVTKSGKQYLSFQTLRFRPQ